MLCELEGMPAGALQRQCRELRRRATEQRDVVRWWAAECRARNAACRARFTAANVAAATEARRVLRHYAEAWAATRTLLRAGEVALSARLDRGSPHGSARRGDGRGPIIREGAGSSA